ncbi:MAG: glycosyltransferase family 39 protein [Verrucomicrobiales bacterium]|nr:glycosyltransferase family 39 protein [Verrucomicrobiales bacterium]
MKGGLIATFCSEGWQAVRSWWKGIDAERRAWMVGLGVAMLWLGGVAIWQAEDWLGGPERAMRRGREMTLEERALIWQWRAVVLDLVGVLLLFLTVGKWTGGGWKAVPKEESRGAWRRREWWILLGGLMLALLVRVPRMELSLYNDEAHNYGRLFAGRWERADLSTPPIYDAARWGETLWWNSGGNNAQPYSVLARCWVTVAQAMGWVQEGEVSEVAARCPALLAGCLGLVLLSWLAWRWWGRGGMVAALALLALHPWHVRYSTEARGQSLMLLGVLLALLCLERLRREDGWRWWLGYAVGLALAAASFIGSAYFLLTLHAVVTWERVNRARRGEMAWRRVARPVVAAGLAAAMAGLLMLPILPELLHILKHKPAFRGEMGSLWLRDAVGMMLGGTRWVAVSGGDPGQLAVQVWLPVWLRWVWVLAGGGAVALGSVAMLRRGGVARLLAVATPLGLVMTWGVARAQGFYLNLWYLFFALPWLVLALAALGTKGWGRVMLVGCLAPGAWVTGMLWDTGKQPNRWPVEWVRGAVYPEYLAIKGAREPILCGFWCDARLYDADWLELRSAADLERLMAAARAQRRDLYVAYSHGPVARQRVPDLVKVVEDEGVFEKVGTRRGLEETQFDVHLFRLRSEGGDR